MTTERMMREAEVAALLGVSRRRCRAGGGAVVGRRIDRLVERFATSRLSCAPGLTRNG